MQTWSALATLALCASSTHVSLHAQTTELRGVWIARDGLSSRQKIIDTLDALAAANIFGTAELALPIPFQFGLSGLPIYVQGLAIDAGAIGGAVLTPAATTTLH